MSRHYVVTAAYVTATTAVTGGRAAVDLPRGTVLPDDVPAEELQRLLAAGTVTRVDVTVVPEPRDGDEVPDGTGVAVLAWVGDDRARAARALAAETAKGEKARKTLVERLTALAGRD